MHATADVCVYECTLHQVWVAPSPLEKEFGKCDLISQILICGSPHKRAVSAVVVLSRKGQEAGGEGRESHGGLQSNTVAAILRTKFTTLAKRSGRLAHEVPQQILLESEAWTEANGLMTPNGKICRPALARKYSHFARGGGGDVTASQDGLGAAATHNVAHNCGVEPALCAGLVEVLQETIPSITADMGMISGNSSLYDLGADSLATAQFAAGIERQFGVVLSVAQVLRDSWCFSCTHWFTAAGSILPCEWSR